MKKRYFRLPAIILAFVLAGLLLCSAAMADGEEPFGDGNGILSRPLLASLYKWLGDMDLDTRHQMSFEAISNAVGKWGRVREKTSEKYHGADWTDGEVFVTVTFKNIDGFWGADSLTTTLSREEYEAADTSFLSEEEGAGSLLDGLFSFESIQESPYIASGDLYLEEDEDGDFFVNNNFTADELAFSHNLESDQYYSYTDFDLFIWNSKEDRENPLPILRLFIYLYTKDIPVNIDSLTFTAAGKEYTFSDLYDEDAVTENEGDWRQRIVLRFDQNSLPLLTDLALDRIFGDPVPLVLHGEEEIHAELGDSFYRVFLPYWDLYTESDASFNLSDYSGTPMVSQLAR